jgi:hypothetical protein
MSLNTKLIASANAVVRTHQPGADPELVELISELAGALTNSVPRQQHEVHLSMVERTAEKVIMTDREQVAAAIQVLRVAQHTLLDQMLTQERTDTEMLTFLSGLLLSVKLETN